MATDLLERLRGWADMMKGQRLLGLPDRLKEDLWDAAAQIEKADRLNELCLARIDKLTDAQPDTQEAIEVNSLADAVEAYETLRWPVNG